VLFVSFTNSAVLLGQLCFLILISETTREMELLYGKNDYQWVQSNLEFLRKKITIFPFGSMLKLGELVVAILDFQ
jgi:hypothetical protein